MTFIRVEAEGGDNRRALSEYASSVRSLVKAMELYRAVRGRETA